MALFQIDNVKISGIAACVPAGIESNRNYTRLTETERNLLIKTTGIENKHVAQKGTCTSDLCFSAAEKLLTDLKWDRNEVDVLIFVSQSGDYLLPATGVILQERLGLSRNCLAFDMGLGCSGYVYGLSVISSMLSSGALRKGLLLVGDVSTDSISPEDKSTYPLFGDAGTATALENVRGEKMYYNLQSDGSGYEAIIIRHGQLRHPQTAESTIRTEIEPGICRSPRDLELNGMQVFDFGMREVAPNIRDLVTFAGKELADADFVVFHQANLLMNETIRKKLKIEPEKVPYSLKEYGNTSSASIPLTFVTEVQHKFGNEPKQVVMSGFGVGLSWGSAWTTFKNPVISDLVIL